VQLATLAERIASLERAEAFRPTHAPFRHSLKQGGTKF
jgi:hypothetical protein